MEPVTESVHVHWLDRQIVIEEYQKKGYVLKERTQPTIIAQDGFERLVFVKAETGQAGSNTTVYLG